MNYKENVKQLAESPYAAFVLMGIFGAILIKPMPEVKNTSMASVVPESSVAEVKKEPMVISPLILAMSQAKKDRLLKVGQFKLPADITPNNIPRYVTKVQLQKNEYFLALASQAEGFHHTIYKDNEGFALGTGWNLSKQSMEYNKSLAQAVFDSHEVIRIVENMSAQSPENISYEQMNKVIINPQKSLQITYLIGEKFRKDIVLPGISKFIETKRNVDKEEADILAQKVFNNLQKHEQDAVLYHAYKCGAGAFRKFNNLIGKLVDYSLKTKHVTAESVVEEFNYSYKIKNDKNKVVKVLDKQAQELVGSMFLGPQHFVQVTNIKLPEFPMVASKLKDTKPVKTTKLEKTEKNHKLKMG